MEFKRGRRGKGIVCNTMTYESRCGNYRVVESKSLPYFSSAWSNIAAMYLADWGWDFVMRGERNEPHYHRSVSAAKEACEKHGAGLRAEFIRVPSKRKNAEGVYKKTTRKKLIWS